MASVALAAYLAASRLADPVARPILARRLARGKEDPDRLGERLGRASAPRPDGALVWLHGASVGESLSALPLIGAMARSRGDLHFLVTSGTVTSARRLADVLPAGAVHQFAPVDTALAVRRFLDHWRPDLAIWIESEFWPRLIVETHRRAIPMALVNARLSAASHARWRWLPGMARALLGAFGLVLAQDHATVGRLGDLGCTARYGGNLKAAVPAPPGNGEAVADLSRRLGGRPVWLAASTHPQEEEAAATAQAEILAVRPDALMILAPRHPERGDEIARLLTGRGLAVARRSAGQVPDRDQQVWLADTLGEMALWYALAPVTFVGGSLTDRGGHTPFEPVASGSAVVHGPDTANFAPAYDALDHAGGALRIDGANALGQAVTGLLGDAARRRVMVGAASRTHRALVPDTAAIAAEVLALLAADR